MIAIRNRDDIIKLQVREKLIECSRGIVNYYKFLCFHPGNKNYVILLDNCEMPVRFYCDNLIDRFFTNYSTKDILEYRKKYYERKLKELEQALSELNKK